MKSYKERDSTFSKFYKHGIFLKVLSAISSRNRVSDITGTGTEEQSFRHYRSNEQKLIKFDYSICLFFFYKTIHDFLKFQIEDIILPGYKSNPASTFTLGSPYPPLTNSQYSSKPPQIFSSKSFHLIQESAFSTIARPKKVLFKGRI